MTSIHGALRRDGRLLFDARNPSAKRWLGWTRQGTLREIADGSGKTVAVWTEVLAMDGKRLQFAMHYVWQDSSEELVSENTIAFRSEEEIRQSLVAAGFIVEHVYGNWDRSPVLPASPEMIFVARRR